MRTPSTLCVFPVVSPIHSSMPAAVLLVNEKCLPSLDQRVPPIFGLGGSATAISVPSGIFRSFS